MNVLTQVFRPKKQTPTTSPKKESIGGSTSRKSKMGPSSFLSGMGNKKTNESKKDDLNSLDVDSAHRSESSSWSRKSAKSKSSRKSSSKSKSSRASQSSHSSSASASSKRTKQKPPASVPMEIAEYVSPNERIVISFLDACNRHAPMEEIVSFFSSDKVEVRFEDAPTIASAILAAENQKLFNSFPDMKWKFDSISEKKMGEVLVDELQATGTHMGEPYGFGPFPPVPATNKRVVNDPERLWFRIDTETGKIKDLQIISLGALTGPPGFYTQIGGKLEMPQPPFEVPTKDVIAQVSSEEMSVTSDVTLN